MGMASHRCTWPSNDHAYTSNFMSKKSCDQINHWCPPCRLHQEKKLPVDGQFCQDSLSHRWEELWAVHCKLMENALALCRCLLVAVPGEPDHQLSLSVQSGSSLHFDVRHDLCIVVHQLHNPWSEVGQETFICKKWHLQFDHSGATGTWSRGPERSMCQTECSIRWTGHPLRL